MAAPDAGNGWARLRSVLRLLPAERLPPRLLNVGCGPFPAARTLHGARADWTLWGLDRDGHALRIARRAHSDLPLVLVRADARTLPGLLRGTFGLVIIRHPDLHRRRAWQAILPRLGELVAPGGALLVTLYAAAEADLLPTRTLPSLLPLDEAALAPVALDGWDRYVFAYNVIKSRSTNHQKLTTNH